MTEGAPDPNGIYQYGEDDKRALFSDLLNLGMPSVSTVVNAIVGRLTNLETKTSHLTDSGNLVVGQVGRPPFTSGLDGCHRRRMGGPRAQEARRHPLHQRRVQQGILGSAGHHLHPSGRLPSRPSNPSVCLRCRVLRRGHLHQR